MAPNKKILIAMDDSDSCLKAVRYVGDMVGFSKTMEICLLYVVPEPPPEYYQEKRYLDDYLQNKEAHASTIYVKAQEMLQQAGVDPSAVTTCTRVAQRAETINQSINAARQEGGFDTVVVGKRGVSKAEEFLFGSISNALAQSCNSFTLWIVS